MDLHESLGRPENGKSISMNYYISVVYCTTVLKSGGLVYTCLWVRVGREMFKNTFAQMHCKTADSAYIGNENISTCSWAFW